MNPSSTRLHFHGDATALRFDNGQNVTLPIGPVGLARSALRHDPPTPAELENAIDLVEYALTRSHLAQGVRGELVTMDPVLFALPGLDAPGACFTRDEVESLFNRLTSRALGMPAPASQSPHSREIVAVAVGRAETMNRRSLPSTGHPPGRASSRERPARERPLMFNARQVPSPVVAPRTAALSRCQLAQRTLNGPSIVEIDRREAAIS